MPSLKSCLVLSAFLFLATALAGAPASAQQVGQAVVDGRVVILNSDGTWQFRDEIQQTSDCQDIGRFSLCLSRGEWSRLPASGAFNALFSRENKYYFGVLIEPQGTKQGMAQQFFQGAILSNAALAAGTTAENVTVHDVIDGVGGKLGLNGIIYSISLSGSPFLYYNAFKVYENESVQFVFWKIGETPDPEFLDAVTQALQKIERKG